jgi:hypothetical protein
VQRSFRVATAAPVLLVVLLFAESAASADDRYPDRRSFVSSVARGVAFDPTTYAPAIIAYDATTRDWASSQAFFRHGFLEQNDRFTVSGRPDDVPVGYEEGNRRILMDALGTLEMSIVNNVTNRVMERALLNRYAAHRRFVKTLGWIERTAFATYAAYALSHDHYRQWRANEHLARQLGY